VVRWIDLYSAYWHQAVQIRFHKVRDFPGLCDPNDLLAVHASHVEDMLLPINGKAFRKKVFFGHREGYVCEMNRRIATLNLLYQFPKFRKRFQRL
jgi:hypothetical protein